MCNHNTDEFLEQFRKEYGGHPTTISAMELRVLRAAIPLIQEALLNGILSRAAANVAEKQIEDMRAAQDERHLDNALTIEDLQKSVENHGKLLEVNNRLLQLLTEIARALGSGRELTGKEVTAGRANALNPEYRKPTFLPKSKPADGDNGKTGDGGIDAAGKNPHPYDSVEPQA